MNKPDTGVDLAEVEKLINEGADLKNTTAIVDWSHIAYATLRAMADELSGLRAARMAYAGEFPLNDEGEPDVGSIHQNIRKLKADHAALFTALLPFSGDTVEFLNNNLHHYGANGPT